MFKDQTAIWVLEYIIGGAMVLVSLIGLGLSRANWTDAHAWATELFVVCLGVTLISCASSMRQRMFLARRIDRLAEQLADSSISS
jgi:phosphatidylglycerophosphate synthase